MRAIGSSLLATCVILTCCRAPSLPAVQAEAMEGKVSFVLFIRKTDKTAEIDKLLDKIRAKYRIDVSTQNIETFGEEKLKFDVLVKLSLEHKIRINQSNRAKQLYTHLLVSIDGKPRTFYPQMRKKEMSISINRFLESLLEGEVLRLHETPVLEPFLKKRE